MNKILNINLGGYALTIDDDAYEYLSAYLESLRRRFHQSTDREEIIRDIESRLVEIITQDLGKRTIVMLPDVEAAIQVMGKPEDFGADPIETGATERDQPGSNSSNRSKRGFNPGRRLFRDEDEKVVGGVCAGLSAYLGVQDPVWVRLAFVAFTIFSAGFWIPAYFLLWIAIPPALTAADRLAMKGQPINIDNIAKEIEEGFDRFGNQVDAMARNKNNSSGTNRPVNGVLSAFVSAIGQIFAFFLRFLGKFGVLILIVIASVLFLSLIATWLSAVWAIVMGAPYLEYFSPFSAGITWMAVICLVLMVGIPIVGLFLSFIRMVFKRRTPPIVAASLATIWTLSIIGFFAFGSFTGREFSEEGEVNKTYDLSPFRNDTLRVEWAGRNGQFDNRHRHRGWFPFRTASHPDNGLLFRENIRIVVERSTLPYFECSQLTRSHGSTPANAVQNAEGITYNIQLENNVLRLPTDYLVPKGKKWRAQEIVIRIGVPEGKSIVFGKSIHEHVDQSESARSLNQISINQYPEKVFLMTPQGLECSDCPSFGQAGYKGHNNFDNFILEGNLETEILKNDQFSVKITDENGKPAENTVQLLRTGDKLSILNNRQSNKGKIFVKIETPDFSSLFASGGATTLRGFNGSHAIIDLKEEARLLAYLDVDDLQINIRGRSRAELSGKGDKVQANILENSELEGSSWHVNNAQVSAASDSKIRLTVSQNADVQRDPSSTVNIHGGASINQ